VTSPVPSAADDIAEAIDASGGALRFDRFVDLALYGPHGFYTATGRAGRRGDFITSPEVGPLFGTLIARWIATEWRRLGEPDDFTIVEFGAGPGTLARSIMSAWENDVMPRYVAVEVSADQRTSHPEHVESTGTAPSGPLRGVVIANELLDNLPFRLLVFDAGWREAHVERSGDRLVEVLHPIDDDLPGWLPTSAPHGARVPWQQAAHQWVVDARRMLSAGTVLAIDYVTPTTAQLAAMPWREWLRTYRGHERGAHYLADPGGQDITAQVALDQLPSTDTVRTQAQLLQLLGIDDLVDEGRAAWQAAAAAPTVAAMRMRSRIREAEALLDPTGLGGFHALTFSVPLPDEPSVPLASPRVI
jgi:SAM-dependent MidA family methyltransferase